MPEGARSRGVGPTEDPDAFRDPAVRTERQFARLRELLALAKERAPGWRARLAGVDPEQVDGPAALAKLPVLRKPELVALHAARPPFGGLALKGLGGPGGFTHVFASPGPIFEPGGPGHGDRFARAIRLAGCAPGDLVLNAFSYHMTPVGMIIDAAVAGIGAATLPAGPGNAALQAELSATLRPTGFVGTPDWLKAVLERGDERALSLDSWRWALVSGGALPPSLRDWYEERGIRCSQCYGTAELGLVAYESEARDGMILDEEVLVEIVVPGTGEPVATGEVGEIVVTVLDPGYPLFRLATGDLSAALPGASPCGRTGMRIRGWMGRADQSAKVRGLFLHPVQIDRLAKRFPACGRVRAVIRRDAAEWDRLVLRCEVAADAEAGFAEAMAAAAREECRLSAEVECVPPGSLPDDGRLVADER